MTLILITLGVTRSQALGSNLGQRQLGVKGYEFSSDLRYVLFRHNVKVCSEHTYTHIIHIHTHCALRVKLVNMINSLEGCQPSGDAKCIEQTFTAHYTVYDVSNDHHIPIRLNDAPKVRQSRLQYVTWLGNTSALLLVAENDIYLRLSPAGSQDHSITETESPGEERYVGDRDPGGWGLRDWEREMIGNRSVSVFLVGERGEREREPREVTGSSKRHKIIATEQLYN
ncbi:unnamed protein product [Timema podura]|uniref:Uncharacterized protein n=1 Tax=Timema podura TaxID=61482 RepID=A0ABN7NWN2_TIMPD|nr:unnamed protein product [Timema podura]